MSKQLIKDSALITLAIYLLNACASAPPPPPPPQTKLWSETVALIENNGDQAKAPKTATISYELWTSSAAFPPLSRIEVTLAVTGVLADLNGSQGQYDISVGEGACQTQWSTLNDQGKALQTERLSQCRDQLDDRSYTQLKSAKSLMAIDCKGLSGGGLIDLHNMVVSVAKAIESPNAIEGEKTVKQYPTPTWVNLAQSRCGIAKKINQYFTKDQLRFSRHKLSENAWGVWTRGMSAFGLPEIAFLMVEEARLENAESKLLSAADFILRSEGLREGQLITSGTARGMYVQVSKIQDRFQRLKTLPETLKNAMGVVNPDAKVDDFKALKKVTRRFTLR
jgi:hypothetical protein